MKNCQYCGATLTPSRRKNCSKCSAEAKRKRNQNWHTNNKEHRRQKDAVNHRSPSYRWHLLLQNAKKRSLIATITREQFEELSKQPCHYCNGKLDVDSGWGSHIDRLDNLVGYTCENSVSCCDFCNRIKQDLLSPLETKAAIQAIIKVRENDDKRGAVKTNTRVSDSGVLQVA
jgi:hypothetical protein